MELVIGNIEFILMDVVLFIFIAHSIYQAIRHKKEMTYDAYHHFLSHIYILIFIFIGLNMFLVYDILTPLLFSILYLVQHVFKENLRLIKNGTWRKDLEKCSPNFI